jgi:hypothetical protein
VLFDEAWLHHMPETLLRYANRLMACAAEYANVHNVEHVLTMREIPDMGEEHQAWPEHIAHILASAARWAEFWSSRGHGMEADF